MDKNNKISIELEKDGTVRNEGIHDAEILRLTVEKVDEKENVEIFIKAESGQKYVLSLLGVKLLNMHFWGAQNIVSDLIIKTKYDPSKDLGQIEDYESFAQESLETSIKKLKSGEFKFVNLVPSVGCELIAICSDVTLRK